VRRTKDGDPLDEGLRQLDDYLDRHHLGTGYLVIFDRRAGKAESRSLAEISEVSTQTGRAITLLRA
jgi:hypothetical protein